MDPELGAVVGFDDAELALNRAGRMSQRQLGELQRARTGGRRYALFVLVALVVFVVLIVVVLVPKLKDNQSGSGQVPVVPIVGGVLAFIVLVMSLTLLRTRRRLDRLASGRVLTASGAARTRVRRMHGNVESDADYGEGERYELTIGDTTFFVAGRRVLDAFATSGMYRAYYAAGGGHAVMNRLLSVERVG